MRFTKVLLVVSLLALVAAPLALAIRFTDDDFSLPAGQTGKAYSVQLHGAGGCGPALPYQFTILGGGLPPGLSMPSSGLISGTPTQTGIFSFWVNLSDQNPPSAAWCRPAQAQRQLTITILSGLSIDQRAPTLTPAQVNTPYSFQFTATGGTSLTWSVKTGSLPPGLTLNTSTGLLSGTATTAGDYNFQIQTTDGTRTDVQTYTLSVVPQLKVTAPPAAAGEVGQTLNVSLSATGGKGGYVWSLAGGTLPTGVTLDGATGALTGAPTVPGTFPLKFQLTDSSGLTTSVDVRLVVASRLALAKLRLHAHAGTAFSTRLHALGGLAPRSWKLLHAPRGVHLGRRTGILTGTLSQKGTFRIAVEVRDRLGVLARMTLFLKVA
jgi:Putative Ig domain